MSEGPREESPSRQELLEAVERTLARAFRGVVRVAEATEITGPERRNLLLRCSIEPSGGATPATVIVKHVRGNYDLATPDSWDTIRFLRELCGALFLDTAALPGVHLPRFFGGDAELGFVVLEDLGLRHGSLVEPLLGGDAAAAERALLTYMERLGRMHADCVAGLPAYDEIARRFGPRISSALADRQSVGAARTKAVIEKLEAIMDVSADARRDLDEVLAAVSVPGPFRTFVHGDPCPDNVFYDGDSLRLIDLELARPGSALLDGVYPRMGFPTCWCANRVPVALVASLEAAYRKELARGCPEARDDDLFAAAVVDACGYWLFITMEWLLDRALIEDERWGISGKRARILARLQSFIRAAEQFQRRTALRIAAGRLLDSLRTAWPDVEALLFYPPFRRSG